MTKAHSGSLKRLSWNSDKVVGPRTAFTVEQALQNKALLNQSERWQELCLFMMAVDTMLRGSDLLKLKVEDIATPGGNIRETFGLRQQKTGQKVEPYISSQTRRACKKWIEISGKSPHDFLFTGRKGIDAGPMSTTVYRRWVKGWAQELGLEPHSYSGHSLRRTKPIFLYQLGVSVENIGELLGHRNIETTRSYLGISAAEAKAIAKRYDIFTPRKQPQFTPAISPLSQVDVERVAGHIFTLVAEHFDLFALKNPTKSGD